MADLAQVRGADEKALADLLKIPLQKEDLQDLPAALRRLRSEHQVLKATKMHLPQKVSIVRVPGFSREEFERQLLNHLFLECADCEFDLRLDPRALSRLSGDWRFDRGSLKLSSSLLVGLIHSSGAANWVPVRLQIRRPVLVTKSAIALGQKISLEDVTQEIRDVSSSRELPARIENLQGQVGARNLLPGRTVMVSDLKKEEWVKAGQPVRLMMSGEDFEISMMGLSQQNGTEGDRVRLKIPDSGKLLTGIVVGPGMVRIE